MSRPSDAGSRSSSPQDVDLAIEAIGFRSRAMLSMSTVPAKLDRVGRALADLPEVPFVAATTGSTNLVAAVLCHNDPSLYEFITGELAEDSGTRRGAQRPRAGGAPPPRFRIEGAGHCLRAVGISQPSGVARNSGCCRDLVRGIRDVPVPTGQQSRALSRFGAAGRSASTPRIRT